MLGVADGVGGSKTATVDPGEFSRRLMAWCHRYAEDGAMAAVQRAREAVKTDKLAKKGGSSTVLLATLTGDRMELCCLGDSVGVLLRPRIRMTKKKQRVIYPRPVLKTCAQTWGFNSPYQTAADDRLEEDGTLVSWDPDTLSAVARVGDICVLATDGLWDNVNDVTVERIVSAYVPALWAEAARQNALRDDPSSGLASSSSASLIAALLAEDSLKNRFSSLADALTTLADNLVQDATDIYSDPMVKETPFSVAAALDGYKFPGGKADDVTVVVGLVVPDDVRLPEDDASPLHNFGHCGLPS